MRRRSGAACERTGRISGYLSGRNSARVPWLAACQVAPSSSVRKTPTAEMPTNIRCAPAIVNNNRMQAKAARAGMPPGPRGVFGQAGNLVPSSARRRRCERARRGRRRQRARAAGWGGPVRCARCDPVSCRTARQTSRACCVHVLPMSAEQASSQPNQASLAAAQIRPSRAS